MNKISNNNPKNIEQSRINIKHQTLQNIDSDITERLMKLYQYKNISENNQSDELILSDFNPEIVRKLYFISKYG